MKKTKLISIILTVVMLLSVVSVSAFAADNAKIKGNVSKIVPASKLVNNKFVVTGPIKKGDVNCDGNVTIADAKQILKKVADLMTFTEAQMVIADMNDDGNVTIADAKKVLQIVAGVGVAPSYPYFTSVPDFGKVYNVDTILTVYFDSDFEEVSEFDPNGGVAYYYTLSKINNTDKYFELLLDNGFAVTDYYEDEEGYGYVEFCDSVNGLVVTAQYEIADDYICIVVNSFVPLSYEDFDVPDFGEVLNIESVDYYSNEYVCGYYYSADDIAQSDKTVDDYAKALNDKGFYELYTEYDEETGISFVYYDNSTTYTYVSVGTYVDGENAGDMVVILTTLA